MGEVNESAVIAPEMLKLSEVAVRLRKSTRTLREPQWLTRLGAIKVGRDYLVRADAVNTLLTGAH